MTAIATFTLTGKLYDYAVQPLVGVWVVVVVDKPELVDPALDRIYSHPPILITDAGGNLCRRGADGTPGTPGVQLPVGLTYTLYSAPDGYLEPVTFTASASWTTKDLADILAGSTGGGDDSGGARTTSPSLLTSQTLTTKAA